MAIQTEETDPELFKTQSQSYYDNIAKDNQGLINSSVLGNTQSLVTVPEKKIITNWSGVNAGITAENKTLNEKTTSAIPDSMKYYMDSLEKAPSGAEQYIKQYGAVATPEEIQAKEAVKTEASSKLKALETQLSGITASAEQAKLQLEQNAGNKDVTSTFLGRQQADIDRRAAIQSLPLQTQILAQKAIVTDNAELLKNAQDKLDKYFSLIREDDKNTMDYNNELKSKIYEYMTAEEKTQADEKEKQETRDYNTSVNNLNQAQTWATTAISQGQGDLAGQIMALDPKSKDYQVKLGELAKQIKAKPTTTGNTIKSGSLVIPESSIAAGQQVLDATRGNKYTNEKGEEITPTGVDAQYVNSKKYLEMLQAWKDDRGLEQDFFTNYPPKNYLNPNDQSIPSYLRDKLKVESDGGFESF